MNGQSMDASAAPQQATNGGGGGGGGGGKKRLSVERIYQKKSPLEHILLRPDTYIGSVNPVTEKMWVLDRSDGSSPRIVNKEITYVPGLFKIFDEILVNAADNKVRDKKMDTIKIDINADKNEVRVYNNGRGIPVEQHKEEKMWVPTMIFGHLLTSSNFDDEQEKVTGGRNGYGAKLCNVFSRKFTVETAAKESKRQFRQSWTTNMTKPGEPKIKDYGGEDFTLVTFQPDLQKFGMERLDDDTIALLSRRAYDVAASTRGVKVMLNGKRVPVKTFKDYIDFFLRGHEDETGNQIKCIHEQVNERWEVGVAVSDNGFQQMSFANSIATTKGGRHVDYVSKMIEAKVAEVLKKKNKGGVNIKPHQIRNHLWVFVNCLIVNPTFDSQTKENMTLQANKFGSKCALSPKFVTQLQKSGIIDSVLAWSKFKADQEMKNKHSSKKTNKLKGIAKLEDANDAGTRNSVNCTLILTEGDSAKTLAVAGLSVIGRDKYGVYPLRGKLLNVREATHKQIMENKEINEMVKIIGLQYKKKYTSMDDLKTLRYGKLMIMTDQDQDGSHIKGLLINFIHHNWPSLLKLPFLEEFITPIVKATKGTQSFSFFSLPEFQEWKSNTDNWHTFKIKYYKGLGTSTSKEAKEYFSDMRRHQILFSYQNEQDDHAINMAFSKKAIEQRKEWLTTWMEDCKRRNELGLPEIYLYEKNTRAVTYSDFVNKELVLFSNMDNERSIPCMVDGFKPGQRKVIFTCLKRNDKREVKVAQLAGSVGEMSAYHHGEMSLMGTIINLAQNFVGSNNVNLLMPNGQFGTRLAGGKDHASPRYIFTQMSPLTRLLFNKHDDALLNYLSEDNQKIEPTYYVPIIPMVLVNGADGIGTGWMTKIPNYNPREIVNNLRRMLDGLEPEEMVPWFKNFKGVIEKLENQRYIVNGEISSLSDTKIEISELPIRTWTQSYKESVMEAMLNGTEKQPAQIQDYKEYHTDKTVKFTVQMSSDKLRQAELQKGLHQYFKLQTTISTGSMVLFDSKGCLRRYDSATDVLKEFYTLRLDYYAKRKAYLEGILEAEALKLSNQARFILEKCDNTLVVENKKRKVMIEELQRKGYDSDPVRKWKISQETNASAAIDDDVENSDDEDGISDAADYDYLLGMAMWSLTMERKQELLRKKDEKHQELRVLRGTSKEELWQRDLSEFMEKLDEVEEKEAAEDALLLAKAQGGGKKKALGKGVKAGAFLPSPVGIRIAPRIADEMRVKAAKAAAAKDKKDNKKPKVESMEVEKDEFDFMCDDKEANRSLSDKLGVDLKDKKKGGGKKKATKKVDSFGDDSDGDDLFGSGGSKKNSKKGGSGRKRFADSSDEDIEDFSDLDQRSDISDQVEKKDRGGMRRTAAKKVVYDMSSGEDNSSDEEKKGGAVANSISDDDVDDNFASSTYTAPKSQSPVKKEADVKISHSDDEDEFDKMIGNGSDNKGSSSEASSPVKKRPAANKYKFEDDDSDEDFEPKKKKKPANSSDDSDDDFNMLVSKSKPKKAAAPSKKKAAVAKDSDDDFFFDDDKPLQKKPKKAAAAAKPKAPAKRPAASDDDSDDDMFGSKKSVPKKPVAAAKKTAAATKKPVAAAKKPAAKKKKASYGSDESEGSGGDSFSFEMSPAAVAAAAEKRERGGGRRAAAAVKYNITSDEDSDF